jgi:hypothetical protein
MLDAVRPVLLVAAFLAVVPAHAQQGPEVPEPPPLPSQREDAGDRVREVERDGGRVLQAEPMQRGGREVYRLKVLTPEGRIRVLHDSRGPDNAGDDRRFDNAARERPDRFERSGQPDRFDAAREAAPPRSEPPRMNSFDAPPSAPPPEAMRPEPRADGPPLH